MVIDWTTRLAKAIAMTQFRIETSPYRIRATRGAAALGQNTVVDTSAAKMVFLEGRHPEYYVPDADVDWKKLATDTALDASTSAATVTNGVAADSNTVEGLGAFETIGVDGQIIGQRFTDGPAAGLVRFDFKAMDGWFEEEEQLFVHARDPYVRVDIIEASRRVEVTVGGVLVAATDRPRLVTETGLPGRWYIPRIDINLGLLQPSPTQSSCGYKGQAKWWNVAIEGHDVVANAAWGYQRPVPTASKLASLICFFAEKEAVETTVDGERVEMPAFGPSMINPSLYLQNQTL
ncbi:MAG: DUF427 domain-containing protein [Acidimicrobiales bacterium]